MTSQVIFKIDKKVKENAMRRARREGMPFASVLKLITKAYAEERFNIGVTEPEPEPFNEKTRKELTEALEDIKHGRNLSPEFDASDIKGMDAWLNSVES